MTGEALCIYNIEYGQTVREWVARICLNGRRYRVAQTVQELGMRAREAALEMAVCGIETRNRALESMAAELLGQMDRILAANEADIRKACSRVNPYRSA